MFPRVLHLVSTYPELTAAFAEGVAGVPTWMFIAWISQIVPLLDKEFKFGKAIAGLCVLECVCTFM